MNDEDYVARSATVRSIIETHLGLIRTNLETAGFEPLQVINLVQVADPETTEQAVNVWTSWPREKEKLAEAAELMIEAGEILHAAANSPEVE